MIKITIKQGAFFALSILSAPNYFNNLTAQAQPEAVGALATLCPLLHLEALIYECVFDVENGKSSAHYIDEITKIIGANKRFLQQRYQHIDLDELIKDIQSIKHSSSVIKVAWRLRDYWEFLPKEFWDMGNWERRRLIGKRLKWQ